MPAKNSIKIYVENTYYHVYNRGVEKRPIFLDTQDYKVYLSYLKEYLSKPPQTKKIPFTLKGTTFKGIPRLLNNYHQQVELLAYCLMPNHFHLLVKQIVNGSLKKFMQSVSTRYSVYFNKKYHRVGQLFQGRFKAVVVHKENYLLYLSRYIHKNPREYTRDLTQAYSSYADYLSLRNTKWIKTDLILGYFNTKPTPEIYKINSYKEFVEDFVQEDELILGDAVLEN